MNKSYAKIIEQLKAEPEWLLIARTIYGEARGEPVEGKIAAGYVMYNRNHDKLGWNDILDPKQFSCFNYGDPNLDNIMLVTIDDKVFQECVEVAFGIIWKKIPNPMNGATHYYNHAIVGRDPWPTLKTLGQIGKHTFKQEDLT